MPCPPPRPCRLPLPFSRPIWTSRLPRRKVAVTTAEFFCGTPLDQLVASIKEQQPDIVGLPVYVWNRLECCKLITMLRQQFPDLLLIAGGPEATADPARLLAEAPLTCWWWERGS